MFCFNPKFSPFGGKMNNLKKCTLLKCMIPQNPESITVSPYSDTTSEKSLHEGTLKIGSSKNEKKRNKIEYKQIPVAD